MWRHFLHHTHARCGEFQIHPHLPCEDILNFSKCGEILEIYTSIIWRNQKFLHMTDFFSTYITCDTCDKYEVCSLIVGNMINEDIEDIVILIKSPKRQLVGMEIKGKSEPIPLAHLRLSTGLGCRLYLAAL